MIRSESRNRPLMFCGIDSTVIAMLNIAVKSFWLCLIACFFSDYTHAGIPIQHWRQPDGAQVFLVESRAIPMIDVQVDFDAGGRRDPPLKAGLAMVTAGMMSKGLLAYSGASALDENALSEAWVDLGARFAGTAQGDRMTFQLRSLTEPDVLQRAVLLAGRQLALPAFDDAVWLRERERLIAAWKEAGTRPASIAAKKFSQLVFGEHPYGREMTPDSLRAIETRDMRAFLLRHLHRCGARVSIVGDIGRTGAEALVSQLLEGLTRQDPNCPEQSGIQDVRPLLHAIDVRQAHPAAQAHILIGQPGIARRDPDYFPLIVGNHILGGGWFVSRLTTEVREKRGLSYSVYSHFSPGLHAGAFTLGLQTRPDQVPMALSVVRQSLQEFVANGPTGEELRAAKDQLIGGFALRIDSNRKLLENVANIAWYGLSLDYLETWRARVEALTVAEIRDAFRKHLRPDQMVTVVVGGAD